MADVLAEILAHKRAEVEQVRAAVPPAELRQRPAYHLPRRNFFGAVTAPRARGPNIIAEIKRRSPSAGEIRTNFDPVAIARSYAAGGAAALSVLTDGRFFGGRLEFIEQVKAAVALPVLRKDFIIDEYQVVESRAAGADAVLLIAEALAPPALEGLLRQARELELWVLLEVHARESLLAALPAIHAVEQQGVLLGINNRDLRTQQVRLETTEQLVPLVPPGVPVVSESGVQSRRDVERLHAAGARALLVGETLMRSPDPGAALDALLS